MMTPGDLLTRQDFEDFKKELFSRLAPLLGGNVRQQKWLKNEDVKTLADPQKAEGSLFPDHQKTAEAIYLNLGFEELSHFSYAFKKTFGQTATQLQGLADASLTTE